MVIIIGMVNYINLKKFFLVKVLNIEFISNNGRKHWFNGNVGLPEQYFNPPLITPYNEYELEDNISNEFNNCNIK